MPYQPHVTDRSGEIRAQGMMQASGRLSQGVGNVMDKWVQHQEENKTAIAQIEAIRKFIATSGQQLGLSQAEIDMFTTKKANMSPIQEGRQMAQLLTMTMQKPVIQQAQANISKTKAEADSLRQGLMQSEKDRELLVTITPFITQGPAAAAKAWGERGGSIEGYQRVVAPMVDAFLKSNEPRPLELKSVDFEKDGVPGKMTYNPDTREVISFTPSRTPGVLTPEDAAKTKTAVGMAEMDLTHLQETYKRGQASLERVPAFSEAVTLLKDPNVRTGPGGELELGLKKVAGMLGADVKGVADAERLQTIIGSTVLANVEKMKGSLSDKDILFLEKIAPSFGKSNEGNIYIFESMMEVEKRMAENMRLAQKLRRQKKSPEEINDAIFEYNEKNPLFTGRKVPEFEGPKKIMEGKGKDFKNATAEELFNAAMGR